MLVHIVLFVLVRSLSFIVYILYFCHWANKWWWNDDDDDDYPPREVSPHPKTRGRIPKQMSTEKMVQRFSIHVPSLVEIGLRTSTWDRRKRVFLIVFFCHAGSGLFWSCRPAAMFGTLTKYSFAIYRSIFTAFMAFLEDETYFQIACVILN